MKVYVCTGLTSRCDTLAHAYHLQKLGGGAEGRLTVIWPIDADCGIHFSEVFAQDMFEGTDFKVVEVNLLERTYFDCHKSDGVRLNMQKGHYGKAFQALWLILADLLQKYKRRLKIRMINTYIKKKQWIDYMPPAEIGWSGDSYREYTKNRWHQVSEALESGREVCIRAYCGIMKDDRYGEADLSVLKFRDNYWKTVEEIIKPNENFIGVHIRRTDHDTAIKESSTKAFIDKLDEELSKNGEMKIFLATDDEKEEERLRDLYGDKLVVQSDKVWGRRSGDAMRSGIIDCLCLSRCGSILGSSGSVYSSFAARYGGKRLIVCKEGMDGGKK